MRWILVISFCLAIFNSVEAASYSIGRDSTWFPSDLKEKNAHVNLFVNAIFEKIEELEGTSWTIVDTSPLNLEQGLLNKEYDAILTISSGQDEFHKYDFSKPLLFVGPVLVLPLNSSYEKLSDLCGKIVGVNQYDEALTLLQRYPSIQIKKYDSMAQALQDLSQGLTEAVVMDNLQADAIVANLYSQKLKVKKRVITNQAIRLKTIKGEHQKLLRTFNHNLEKLHQNKSYEKLYSYAFPLDP